LVGVSVVGKQPIIIVKIKEFQFVVLIVNKITTIT